MKEIFNYTVSVAILILVVLCVISPVEVFAEGNGTNYVTYTWQNSVFSEGFAGYESSDYEVEPNAGIQTMSETGYYSSPQSAGACLRNELVDRNKSIVIKYKLASSKLSDKDWFSALCDNILKYAFMHTGVPEEGDSIRHGVKSYNSKAEYLKYKDSTYVTITFDFNYYTTAAQEERLDSQIDDLITDLNIEGKSDYEVIRNIYDYICNHVVYDDGSDELKYSAYSALINETATCQGYAVLFYRLALECDIDVRVITGKGKAQHHAWNIVAVDGNYYNADPTWDAGADTYNYFLKGSECFDNHTRNSEFLSNSFNSRYPINSANYVCKSHVWESDYTIDSKASYAGNGSKSIHCSICDAKKNDSITSIPQLICKLPAPKSINTELTSKYGTAAGYDDIKVSWTKVSGASGYYVKYRKHGTKSWKSVTTPNQYYIMKNMIDGVRYDISVIPYVIEKNIKYKSNNSKSTTSVYTLKKTNVTGKIKNPFNKVTFKWKGINGESGYQIYRSAVKNGKYTKVGTVNAVDKKTVSLKLKAKKGKTYWYKVRAYKKIGDKKYVYGPWSDKVKFVR